MSWKMQLFNRDGTYVADLTQATARQIQLNLNGIDQLTFTVPLSAPEASVIRTLSTSVKVWRTINIPGGASYSDPPELPAFAGVVAARDLTGSANSLSVTVYGAFWRLQSRFTRDNSKDHNISCSQYLWNLIFRTNMVSSEQGGDGPGRTGIVGPSDALWGAYGHWAPNDPVQLVWRTQRGTQLWQEIQDKITAISATGATLELHALYAHLADHKRLVYFNTTNHLGSLPSNPIANLDYHTGSLNCEDFQANESADPTQFANYLIMQGQGDKDNYTLAYPKTYDVNGWARINFYGIYQMWLQNSKWDSRTRMRTFAHSTLVRKALPPTTYQPTISPALGPWMSPSFSPYSGGSPMPAGTHFRLGDNIRCKADKGALQVPDPELVGQGFEITSGAYAVRRIYTIQLDMDDFGFERATLTLAPDFSDSSTLF